MLYLEDFLELIENLPAELRDRFTEIRELDLQVQNGLDQSEARVRGLFRAATSIPPDERQIQFDKIKEEYRKILEDSDEKVNLATTVHDLLKRYLAKLDVEIAKFKMELEADKPGITEMLEQSLKGGQATANAGLGHKKERRRRRGGGAGRGSDVVVNGGQSSWMNGPSGLSGLAFSNGHGREPPAPPVHHAVMGDMPPAGIGRGSYASYIRKSQSFPNRMMEVRPSMAPGMMHPSQLQQQQQHLHHQQQQQHQMLQPQTHHPVPTQPPPSYFQQQLQQQQQQQQQQQMQQQIQPSMQQNSPATPAIRERTGTGSGSSYGFLPSFTDQPESRHGRPRKLTTRVQEMLKEASHRHERLSHDASTSGLQQQLSQGGSEDEEEAEGSGAETADMSDQNDQQRWCICNQVSYGEMVACDNKDCPFEWFHYQCVNITAPPKGKWFCPHCTAVMKRRNSKGLINP